jgi:hypothetical protein
LKFHTAAIGAHTVQRLVGAAHHIGVRVFYAKRYTAKAEQYASAGVVLFTFTDRGPGPGLGIEPANDLARGLTAHAATNPHINWAGQGWAEKSTEEERIEETSRWLEQLGKATRRVPKGSSRRANKQRQRRNDALNAIADAWRNLAVALDPTSSSRRRVRAAEKARAAAARAATLLGVTLR